jgi:hypothetical protein
MVEVSNNIVPTAHQHGITNKQKYGSGVQRTHIGHIKNVLPLGGFEHIPSLRLNMVDPTTALKARRGSLGTSDNGA